ncbi:MAG: AI-2E family transporter [Nitrospinota bacterium]|nr:AI-2E family transporter [Nitrospinota bacterium]
MEQEKSRQAVILTVIVSLIFLVLLYFSRRVVTPFVVAFALAYLLDPLADKLESFKISRTFSVFLLMGGFFFGCLGAGLLVFPMFRLQAESLIKDLPGYLAVVQEWIRPVLNQVSDLDPEKAQEILNRELIKFGELPLKILTHLTGFLWDSITGLFNIILMIANIVIIPVAMFYLLRDFDQINEKFFNLIPPRNRDKTREVVKDIDQVLAGFVRGQLMVALIMAFFYFVGLYLCGTPMSLFIAILAGLANLVPYLGLILGFVPAATLTFLQTQEWFPVLGVAGVFAVVQAFEGMLITPRVVGENIGLHPVAIMLAVLLGAEFFGFMGVLLAVPVVAVFNILLSRGFVSYKKSSFFTSS